jgi:hypothetical protein
MGQPGVRQQGPPPPVRCALHQCRRASPCLRLGIPGLGQDNWRRECRLIQPRTRIGVAFFDNLTVPTRQSLYAIFRTLCFEQLYDALDVARLPLYGRFPFLRLRFHVIGLRINFR